MAEELKVWEKRPGERRIDHPDFPDVQGTTFAKGAITDFPVVSTDPFKVKPLVKVSIDGKETDDYLPLFYKPKAGYWEDRDVEAQDFDPETMAYTQAWQSFRCGDEVVVLLKKGEPKMVLGFYDNYPRIGEDVVKWVPYSGDPPEYGRVSQRTNTETWGYYNFENDIGPDGKPLHLTVEAESVWSDIYYWVDEYIPRYFRPRNGYGAKILENDRYKTPRHPRYWCPHYRIDNPNGNCIWGGGECSYSNPDDRIIVIIYDVTRKNKIGSKCSAHLVPVGPILYVIYGIWEAYSIYEGSLGYNDYVKARIMCDALKEWLEDFVDGYDEWDKPFVAYTMTEPPIIDILEDKTQTWEYFNDDHCLIKQVKAGLYTSDLYDEVLSGTLSPMISWTSFQAHNWNWSVDHFPYTPDDLYWQWFGENNLRYGGPLDYFITHEKDKLMIRPHTKEELMKAGLWPSDDNKEGQNE